MGKRRANGEGNIRKRTNGIWEGRMKINGLPKSVYGKTQSEVRMKLTEIRNDLDNDDYIEPTDATVKEWLDLWQEEYHDSGCLNSCKFITMNPAHRRFPPLVKSLNHEFSLMCVSQERKSRKRKKYFMI